VTAVVCAAFDDAADAAVRRLITRLAESGTRVRPTPRHRPHVTLGAAKIRPGELTDVLAVAAHVATGTAQFPVVLDHIGAFPGGGVLWLGPRPDPELHRLQRDVDAALVAAGWEPALGERGKPGRWTPHVTLATRLRPDALGPAVTTVATRFRPIRGHVAALATILVAGAGDEGLAPLAGEVATAPPPAASGSG
jgi:2'-5' RNA ligase